MKRNPTSSLPILVLLFIVIPFISNAQDLPIIAEKNHATGLHLVGYSNETNSVEGNYAYKILKGNTLSIHVGMSGGIYYPRKKVSTITSEQIFKFIAPNIRFEYGNKRAFFVGIWKNFMSKNKAPYKAALGYKHYFAQKHLSLVIDGNFLWIKEDSGSEPSSLLTYGGIGIGLNRYF